MNRITSKFDRNSTAKQVLEGINLRGKNVIVTGGSSGLGIETARAFAAAGADVTLPVRNVAKGQAVAEDLTRTTGNPNIHVMEMDLANYDSAIAFGRAFVKLNKPLHILVNNAAIMAGPLERINGHESQFATNHLGHFAMTRELLPSLLKAKKARVVALTSTGHRYGGVDFEDIHFEKRPYDKWIAYGQAKSANALFALEFNRRYAAQGITANAVHPGGIMTGLQKNLSQDEMRASGWIDESGKINPLFKNIEQGAATSVWAATAPELEGIGGLYLEDCAEGVPMDPVKPRGGYMPHVRDVEAAKKLWDVSEKLLTV